MAPGCVDGDADQDSSGGSGGDPELCVPNTGDGRTQCGANICEAGERCTESGLIQCLPGCLETLNCGPQEWCDLRTSSAGEPGLCRSVNDAACGGVVGSGTEDTADAGTSDADTSADDTTGASCPEVQGNYTLSLASSSPDECDELLEGGDTCSVSQDGCAITWGCEGPYAPLLVPGSVNSNGVYETSGTYLGFSYTCEFEFLTTGSFSADLDWSCSVGQSGQAVLCEGSGFL